MNAEEVAKKYRLSMEVAQQMIDAGAVEDGEILFVDEMARIEFYAMLDDDLDDMPPDPPRATWRVWSNVEHKWFARQARGYTSNIEESGRFMPMEALQIYQRAAQGWNPQQPFPISITLVPV